MVFHEQYYSIFFSPNQWPGFQLIPNVVSCLDDQHPKYCPMCSFHESSWILDYLIYLFTWTYVTWHVAMREQFSLICTWWGCCCNPPLLDQAPCHWPPFQSYGEKHMQMVAIIPGWSWVVFFFICFIWGRWTHFDVPLVEMGGSTTN